MSTKNWNNKNQRRGAAVLLEELRSEGVRYVFGNPGTTELPLIDALVDAAGDTNGLPIQLALTAGEAHDNRLAGKLLSRLRSGTMLLADRGLLAQAPLSAFWWDRPRL